MSYDFNLTTQCDHLVFRELDILAKDARTIHLAKPMAVSLAQIYAVDNFVPPSMYQVVNDPADPLKQMKMIKFNNKWRSPTDYFEISYTTMSSFCSKCAGNNFFDDISYDVTGDIFTIENEKLLMQNVEKFIVTKINSNPFHLFIGTSIIDVIGTRLSNPNLLVTQITAEASKTLQKFQELQTKYQLTGRTITPGEILKSVNNITVTQNQNDPTIYDMNVAVTAQSGQTIEFTQYIKIYN
jgi:hypothetical protein